MVGMTLEEGIAKTYSDNDMVLVSYVRTARLCRPPCRPTIPGTLPAVSGAPVETWPWAPSVWAPGAVLVRRRKHGRATMAGPKAN